MRAMATFGSRPALYKPTDFLSQQKRIAAAVSHIANVSSSAAEVKAEEEKPTFKIQQRPPATASSSGMDPLLTTTPTTTSATVSTTIEEKTPATPAEPLPKTNSAAMDLTESTKAVKILTDNIIAVDAAKKISQAAMLDEKPGGVAQKDLDKIAKLKEFMARQQTAQRDEGKSVHKANVATIGEKHIAIPMVNGKSDGSKTPKLFSTQEGKLLNGDKNPPGILTGVATGKSLKENQDPTSHISKDEKARLKGVRDAVKDIGGKKKGVGAASGDISGMGRGGQRGTMKNTPTSITAPGKGVGGKGKQMGAKQPATKPSPNGNARTKTPGTKPPMSNGPHKNRGGQYDRTQAQGGNSSFYSSQGNKMGGFPNNNEVPHAAWLPYAMNTMNMNGGSILGQPTGPRVDFSKLSSSSLHHGTDKDGAKNGPAKKV